LNKIFQGSRDSAPESNRKQREAALKIKQRAHEKKAGWLTIEKPGPTMGDLGFPETPQKQISKKRKK
jgi:hypothetical protein